MRENNGSYSTPKILSSRVGNNAFAWEERREKYEKDPILTIPSLIDGTIDDIAIGEDIVFEEMEGGVLRSCRGLEHFVRIISGGKSEEYTNLEIIIFDNHNHALYFWIDAVRRGIMKKGFTLIHIDEHSDLWDNPHNLEIDRAIADDTYTWEFANHSCNVGNYIQPALRSGLVGEMIRIENEYQIDHHMDSTIAENSILNLDIDIFAPELDHIPEEKKIRIIKNLMKQVNYVTIATSPYFIEQGIAIEKLKEILHSVH